MCEWLPLVDDACLPYGYLKHFSVLVLALHARVIVLVAKLAEAFFDIELPVSDKVLCPRHT
jgi:hypothetical protein